MKVVLSKDDVIRAIEDYVTYNVMFGDDFEYVLDCSYALEDIDYDFIPKQEEQQEKDK